MSQYSYQPYSELCSTSNFTSEFFANFINNSNSHLEESVSSPSQKDSSIHNQSCINNDFSVNEQKIMTFHLQNLLSISQVITKRVMMNRWIVNKDRLKVLQKRTQIYLTKVFLKIFYTLSIKLQVKKLVKNYQEAKQKAPNTLAIQAEEHADDRKTSKIAQLNIGVQKLIIAYQRIKDKYNLPNYKQSFNRIIKHSLHAKYFTFMAQVLSRDQQMLEQGWQGIKRWRNYIQKVQILEGTLNLVIHQAMRRCFLAINLERSSLEHNDISNIQERKSQKESFKMNSSVEIATLQRQLLSHCQTQKNYLNEEQQGQNNSGKQSNQFKKKQFNDFIDKNNPKNLKFSKDVKHKILSYHTNTSQNQDQPAQFEPPNQFQINSLPPEASIIKTSEDVSMIRRASASNNSLYQSRSILKRIMKPIELPMKKAPAVRTQVSDGSYSLILNEGQKNKYFQNNGNKIIKSKPLKHEQLRKQFTDFNDLFMVREIVNFYQNLKNNNQDKKAISLAKIKQKFNKKTQEEYYKRIIKLPNQQKSLEKIASEPNIDRSQKTNRRIQDQQTFNSIKSSNSQTRSRNHSKQRGRKPEFRIPSELPKNFDYYVDKSLKKQSRIKADGQSIDSETKRKSSSSSRSSKKLTFNIVKSGNITSNEDQKRKKISEIETKGSPKPKIELNIKKKSRQRNGKQFKSPQHPNEYFMFRDPPKKRIKKIGTSTDT